MNPGDGGDVIDGSWLELDLPPSLLPGGQGVGACWTIWNIRTIVIGGAQVPKIWSYLHLQQNANACQERFLIVDWVDWLPSSPLIFTNHHIVNIWYQLHLQHSISSSVQAPWSWHDLAVWCPVYGSWSCPRCTHPSLHWYVTWEPSNQTSSSSNC